MVKIPLADSQSSVIPDSYWYYADLFVLIDNVDTYKSWMLNNYINIIALDVADGQTSKEVSHNISIHFDIMLRYRNYMMSFYDCPFIDFYRVNKESEKIITGYAIISYVKAQIDKGFSVLLTVNRKFLSVFDNHSNRIHQIMIYGYDDQNQIFFFCDNFITGKYRTDLTCSFDDFIQAYNNSYLEKALDRDFNHCVYLFKPIPCPEYKINLNQIKEKILEYNNKLPLDWNDRRYLSFNEFPIVYGTDIYRLYIQRINEFISKEIQLTLNNRDLMTLYDHKKLMLYRMEILMKNHLIPNDNKLYQNYKEITEKCFIVIQLILKYHITENVNILKKVINIFSDMAVQEDTALHQFYDYL